MLYRLNHVHRGEEGDLDGLDDCNSQEGNHASDGDSESGVRGEDHLRCPLDGPHVLGNCLEDPLSAAMVAAQQAYGAYTNSATGVGDSVFNPYHSYHQQLLGTPATASPLFTDQSCHAVVKHFDM